MIFRILILSMSLYKAATHVLTKHIFFNYLLIRTRNRISMLDTRMSVIGSNSECSTPLN